MFEKYFWMVLFGFVYSAALSVLIVRLWQKLLRVFSASQGMPVPAQDISTPTGLPGRDKTLSEPPTPPSAVPQGPEYSAASENSTGSG